jgi:cation diffusion facilitator CzcD-associated flavoprotein CzcO
VADNRASYLEDTNRWEVELDGSRCVRAGFLITGVGLLASKPYVPAYPGLDSFRGIWYHTGRWPREPVDFAGKRVGVIGTGSTGVQAIPVIAQAAAHLYVFQRTPQFAIPARHHTVTREVLEDVKRNYDEIWQVAKWSMSGFTWRHNGTSALAVSPGERRATFESMWLEGGFRFLAGSYRDILTDRRANDFVAEFIRSKIRTIVRDQAVAEKLLPVDYPVGARRPILETAYYETYNRRNVTLVDIKHYPITAITERGMRTEEGEYDVDIIVFATGFDAITGPFLRLNIHGRNGRSLADEWDSHGPKSFLGLSMSGFPNMFTITGPGSLFGNLPISIEHHVEWIADCIAYMRDSGYDVAEAESAAQDEWMDYVNEQSVKTLIPLADSSWFTGGNIPGKPRSALIFFGDFGAYRRHVDNIASDGYSGFRMSAFAEDAPATINS